MAVKHAYQNNDLKLRTVTSGMWLSLDTFSPSTCTAYSPSHTGPAGFHHDLLLHYLHPVAQ